MTLNTKSKWEKKTNDTFAKVKISVLANDTGK